MRRAKGQKRRSNRDEFDRQVEAVLKFQEFLDRTATDRVDQMILIQTPNQLRDM